jgi:hypothetical protein
MANSGASVWSDEVSSAEWIGPRLHPFNQDTGSVVPEGFDAYCRIFHPVETYRAPRRWAEVAAENGRVVHPEMQFHMVTRTPGAPPPLRVERGDGPSWGRCPDELRSRLNDVLAQHMATQQECWFCVWEGWGGSEDHGVTARVRFPYRNYLLYRGPIDAPAPKDGFGDSEPPSMWWPDDRSWFVATEIDHAWTYVGGSEELIEDLLGDSRIEALLAQLSDKPFYDSDAVNAQLDGPTQR